MSAKALITGGSGFVGRHCIEPLEGTGCEVHILTRRKQDWLPESVHQHQIDFVAHESHELLINLLNECEFTHLLHGAWVTDHGAYWTDTVNTQWRDRTVQFVSDFYKAGGIRAVALGSCAEYDWSKGVCVEDEDEGPPRTLYGQCKLGTANALMESAETFNHSFAWARLFHLYGPHEGEKRLIPHVIKSCLLGNEVPCSDGEQIRDYMHVQDAADALVTLLLQDLVTGKVNIGCGEPRSIKDVVLEAARIMNSEHLIKFGVHQRPDGDPDCLVPDLSRLKEEVCYVPSFSLQEGLSQTIQFWSDHLQQD